MTEWFYELSWKLYTQAYVNNVTIKYGTSLNEVY